MSFKKYMKDLRVEFSYTQKEMANALDVNLETIKKIEAGRTKMPSNSLIDSISSLTNKNRVRVASDIIFRSDYDYVVEGNDPQYFKDYCAVKYFEGWNVVNFNYEVDLSGVDLRQYSFTFSAWRLISKLNSTKSILVMPASREIEDMDQFIKEPSNRIEFLTKIFGYAAFSIAPIKEVEVIFNANDNQEIKAFELLAREKRSISKIPVTIVLFDDARCFALEEIRVL